MGGLTLPSKAWKSQERRIAARYSSIVHTVKRIALSGSNNTQGKTHSDTDHKRMYVEAKMRKSPPMWKVWLQVLQNAKEEKKIPVLIIQKSGTPTYMAIMDLDRHAKFETMIDLYIAGHHDEVKKLLNELSEIDGGDIDLSKGQKQKPTQIQSNQTPTTVADSITKNVDTWPDWMKSPELDAAIEVIRQRESQKKAKQ